MADPKELTLLLEAYETYLDTYRQRVVDNGPLHGLHKFLLGNSTPSDRKADTSFYRAVEQAVAGLCAVLPNEDASVAVRAMQCMTLETEGTDASSRLMIEATQALAIPLLEWVSTEDAAVILTEYQARYPKKRMLSPRQKELLAALEQKAI